MATALTIPKLGNTVEEVTLVEWRVEDGATVEEGQEILEIETDKATFAVEATASGTIHVGPFEAGDIVPVLDAVAVIGLPEDTWREISALSEPEPIAAVQPSEGPAPVSTSVAAVPQVVDSAAPQGNGERLFVSPRARKLAEAKDVDLTLLAATGPGGRIVERDVLAYLDQRPAATPIARKLAAEAGLNVYEIAGTGPGGRVTKRDVELAALTPAPIAATAPAPSPAPAAMVLPEAEILESVPLKGVRAIIAERMGDSVHTTARVTLVMEVDASNFVSVRARLKERVAETWGFAPGYNDLLGLIVARALRAHPYMNARLSAEAIEYLAHINLGMAVDTERGLLVPNIKNADSKNLRQFGSEFRDLADKARSGRILPDDISGGTFTITSLGPYDVDAFTPVINLPEAAILGVGRIASKAVVVEGEIVAREMVTLSLVFDHRIVDGAPAAAFLKTIKTYIEEPYLLLAE